jgi:predicted transposase/invertase (TIGR01784 family)
MGYAYIYEKIIGDKNIYSSKLIRIPQPEFFEENGTEVMNMLMTEWNWDDALAVRYEEGLEKGLEEGLEKGLEEGLEKTARNALAEGISIDIIEKITGLDLDTIRKLQDNPEF